MLAKIARKQNGYYQNNIDFQDLAERDTIFSNLYTERGRLDWRDPLVLQELTKALLRQDFGLTLTLPDDRLCPPIPVRWNYVRWIQELLDTTAPVSPGTPYKDEAPVAGLDIGTGASSIYSLLACSSRQNYRMIGTDIDSKSLEFARQNVKDNSLRNRVKITETVIEDPVIPLDSLGIDRIDFTICNPPFYSSEDDMNAAYGGKDMPPSAVCTGSHSEMICEGGDIGFATRILDESRQLQTRVRWYTCMLCRLASAKLLVERIKQLGITNFAAANLQAGSKTVRWAIAWSFQDYRPANDVARHGSLVTAILAPATERLLRGPGATAQDAGYKIDEKLSNLDLHWTYDNDSQVGLMSSAGDAWSRKARRRYKQSDAAIETDHSTSEAYDSFIVRISCNDESVTLRWIRGQDVLLFESFCGMVKQTLGLRKGLD